MELPDSARGCCRQWNDVLRGEEPWNDNQSSAYFVTPMFHPRERTTHTRNVVHRVGRESHPERNFYGQRVPRRRVVAFAPRRDRVSHFLFLSTYPLSPASSFSREKFSQNDAALLSLGLPSWYLDRVVSSLTLWFRSSILCVGDRGCFLDFRRTNLSSIG